MHILITDEVHSTLLEGFDRLGWKVDYRPSITNEECRSIILQFEGLIINSKIFCTKDFLEVAVRLRFIARLGSGMEIVDILAAQNKGIKVFSSPEGNSNSVAEHCLGMILTLLHKIHLADIQVRNFVWNREYYRGNELSGKTIGIIGYGHTGQNLARLLRGFNCNILAHDKYKSGLSNADLNVVEASKEDILNSADIISLHLPLTQETINYVDKSFMEQCRQKPILINTSRGKILPSSIALFALESELISGIGMDVFENEKPNTYNLEERESYLKLFAKEPTIFTPHIAGWSIQSKIQLSQILLKKIMKEFANSD